MGAYRDIAVMGPEIKKQKELLEEFARNHANLELEYKVINVWIILKFQVCLGCRLH